MIRLPMNPRTPRARRYWFTATRTLTTGPGHSPFNPGDVFAAVGSGKIKRFNQSGTLLDTLDTGLTCQTLGMAFDQAAHGGLWRLPWEPRSVLPLAALEGLVRR